MRPAPALERWLADGGSPRARRRAGRRRSWSSSPMTRPRADGAPRIGRVLGHGAGFAPPAERSRRRCVRRRPPGRRRRRPARRGPRARHPGRRDLRSPSRRSACCTPSSAASRNPVCGRRAGTRERFAAAGARALLDDPRRRRAGRRRPRSRRVRERTRRRAGGASGRCASERARRPSRAGHGRVARHRPRDGAGVSRAPVPPSRSTTRGTRTRARRRRRWLRSAPRAMPAHGAQADVADADAVAALFAELREALGGPPDVLVNNAAVTHDGLLMMLPEAAWRPRARRRPDGRLSLLPGRAARHDRRPLGTDRQRGVARRRSSARKAPRPTRRRRADWWRSPSRSPARSRASASR